MADAPGTGEAPGESLVKRTPELPLKDPIASRSSSGWMLVSALLLTATLAWSLWDEAFGQRPWKGMQKEFVSRYTRYLDSIKSKSRQSEDEIKETSEYQQLDEEAKAASEQVKPDVDQINQEVDRIQKKLDAVTDPFQNQRGRLTVINYNVEISNGAAKDRYRRNAETLKQQKVTVEVPSDDGKAIEKKSFDYPGLEQYYNELRDNKASLLGEKAEKLKVPTELAKKRDDYLKNHLVGLGPAAIEGLKAKVAKFDYSILGHQISVNAYNIVDRCEVCHVGIREPLDLRPADLAPDGPGKEPDALARAFVSHPNREILAIHNPDKFGCSGCHWGNGRATTSDVKGHGDNKFWMWPMFEKENTEAGCQQCHDAGLATSDWPLSNGQVFPKMVGNLFWEHGHRMVATTVGLLTIVLMVYVLVKEKRSWVRKLGVLALVGVIAQGLLGGLTVKLMLPLEVSAAHATLAQLFFCTTVSLAVFTSQSWIQATPIGEEKGSLALRYLCTTALVTIFLQLILGAILRHSATWDKQLPTELILAHGRSLDLPIPTPIPLEVTGEH